MDSVPHSPSSTNWYSPGIFLNISLASSSPSSTSPANEVLQPEVAGIASMGAPTLDISDDQIEALLCEAEIRLASKNSEQGAVVEVKSTEPSSLALTPTMGESGKSSEPAKKSKDLSVRVPQLVAKKSKTAADDAGPDWYHLPRTNLADPNVKRDLQLLRMRGVLDPKRHFKKDTRKNPLPEFSQVGTLIEGPTEFYSARVTRKERKRTLVEEVLASGESNSKFKTRYNEIQERKTSGKKSHYKKLMARRRRGA